MSSAGFCRDQDSVVFLMGLMAFDEIDRFCRGGPGPRGETFPPLVSRKSVLQYY